jgi:hypothetical protein
MIPILALAWALHATPEALELRSEGGQGLNLLPVLWVAEGAGRARPYHFLHDPATLTGVVITPRAEYRLRTVVEAGLVRQTLEIKDLVAWEVGEESLAWTLPRGPVEALDRAYRFGPQKALVVGPETPIVARVADVLLEGGRGANGLRIHGGELRLEHDHRGHHPFRVYPECTETPQNTLPSRLRDTSPRPAGLEHRMTFTWRPGARVFAVPSRFPQRFQAALALTDHADQARIDRSAAFAYGREDWRAGRAAGEGFVGRGLGFTKSVFLAPAPGYAPQFGDPDFTDLLRALQADGVEIGVHSPSGRRDTPTFTDLRLTDFRKEFKGVTWIDHGPADNCEALTNLGADPQSPWYLVPVLHHHGFTTAWMIPDQPVGPGANLLRPHLPAERAPVIFRHPRLPLRLFATTWLYGPRSQLLRRYRPSELDRLQADFGVSIGHVYLDTFRETGKGAERTLLEKGPEGLRLRADVGRWFDDLAQRHKAGALWVTGVGPLADHLEAALRVDPTYGPQGIEIKEKVSGLTLLVHAPGEVPGATRLNGWWATDQMAIAVPMEIPEIGVVR